ncbi:hypothetical protein GJ744_001673 [Endocarpon pusillum]|uniref:Uncharacterized protein n=1 Tax=Endocarpon pusillum TaxID=364733 RepID=A0A8H7AGR7_9EURO|nr:hypothetical protein GJ744_001673 [Endocarpon pusillum]
MPSRPQSWGPHQIKAAATNPHNEKSAKLEDALAVKPCSGPRCRDNKDWERENLGTKEIWLQVESNFSRATKSEPSFPLRNQPDDMVKNARARQALERILCI